jgi:hypothetical protein
VLSRPLDRSHRPTRRSAGRTSLQKPCSGWIRWAREELNLRPLPCQIQRASARLYAGRLEIGKDPRKAAVQHRCQHPAPPTIRHGPPTVVLVPTAVGCCPSAARRGDADLRDLGTAIRRPTRTRSQPSQHGRTPRSSIRRQGRESTTDHTARRTVGASHDATTR